MSEQTAVKLQWCGLVLGGVILLIAWWVGSHKQQFTVIKSYEDGSAVVCKKGGQCED